MMSLEKRSPPRRLVQDSDKFLNFDDIKINYGCSRTYGWYYFNNKRSSFKDRFKAFMYTKNAPIQKYKR